jgi:hypothetical protein
MKKHDRCPFAKWQLVGVLRIMRPNPPVIEDWSKLSKSTLYAIWLRLQKQNVIE